MGHRILVLLLAVVTVALPQAASALGLGEITSKSALNQPLVAEIKLLQVRDLTEQEVLVGLASVKDFERVGVDRPYFLSNLKFRVELNGPNGPVILVTSTKPVREPFVNFVLQAQWPSGKLLREYTLLMDLPVFSGQQAQPITAAAPLRNTVSHAPVATPEPTQPTNYNPRSSFDAAPERPTSAQPTTAISRQSSRAGEGDYAEGETVPVKANDTLWEIASRVRPNRSVSIQQTMLAIQRLNPNAFINNNINLLRKGQVLRVPSREQITEYSRQDAVSQVAVQNSSWNGDPNGGFGPTMGAQLEGSRSVAPTGELAAGREGRVKLTSPEDVASSAEGRGAGAGSSSVDALENELAITLEQLDKTDRENADLKSRIEALESQIQTMERMIEISSEDMRALELAAEQNRQRQADAEDVPVSDEAALSTEGTANDLGEEEADASVSVAEDAPVETASTEVAPTVEATPTPTPKPKKVVIAATPAEKGILDHIIDNIIFIAGGLVVLLLAVFLFIRQRQASEELVDETDDFLGQSTFDDLDAEETLEQDAGVDDLDLNDFDDFEDPALLDESEEVDSSAEAQTEDVVAEADIYIAYGKLEQAEEMLLNALDREPKDADIRVKLLEVYSQQQNSDKFDPHFATLLASDNASAKQRAEQLREAINGAAPFDSSLYIVEDEATTQIHLDSDDLESSLSEFDSQLEAEIESDFDSLDLDLDQSAEVDLAEAADVTEEQALEESLDFELDLGESQPESAESDDLEFDLNIEDVSADLELDSDVGEAQDESGEFDLSLDDANLEDDDLSLEMDVEPEGSEDLSVEDFDLDFDLGRDTLEGESDNLELESSADEALEALDDFAEFDLGETDTDATELEETLAFDEELGDDLASEIDDENDESADELTLESGDDFGDFDLGDLDLDSDLSVEAESDTEDSLDLELDESLVIDEPVELEGEAVESEDELSIEPAEGVAEDFDLGGLDAEIESLASDTTDEEFSLEDDLLAGELSAEAPESSDDLLDLDGDLEPEADLQEDAAQEPEPAEDLSLTGHLDLSALDQELDALTTGLGVEEADLDSLELTEPAESLEAEADAQEELATPTVMEEPVTDFGDFEDELEADLEAELDPAALDEDEPLDLLMPESVDEDLPLSLDDELEPSLEDEPLDVQEDDIDVGEDTLFEQAIADVPDSGLDFDIPEIDPESDDDDLGFLSDSDETATKLDLARAYIDMGDADGARDILDEIVKEGNAQQKQEAEKLISRI